MQKHLFPKCCDGDVHDFGTMPQTLPLVVSRLSLPSAAPAQSSSDEYPSSPKFRVTVEDEAGGLFVFD